MKKSRKSRNKSNQLSRIHKNLIVLMMIAIVLSSGYYLINMLRFNSDFQSRKDRCGGEPVAITQSFGLYNYASDESYSIITSLNPQYNKYSRYNILHSAYGYACSVEEAKSQLAGKKIYISEKNFTDNENQERIKKHLAILSKRGLDLYKLNSPLEGYIQQEPHIYYESYKISYVLKEGNYVMDSLSLECGLHRPLSYRQKQAIKIIRGKTICAIDRGPSQTEFTKNKKEQIKNSFSRAKMDDFINGHYNYYK